MFRYCSKIINYPKFILFMGSLPFVPPVRYARPVTEHVPLHSKSLCKNMERGSGGANNKILSWGGHLETIFENRETLKLFEKP